MRTDIRSFIKYLRDLGELIDITKPVSVDHEIAAYVRKSCDTNGPSFLFTNIKEFPNRRIVAGLYGTKKRMGLAVGFPQRKKLSTKETLQEYLRCLNTYKQSPVYMEIESSLNTEFPIQVENPNLFELPIGKYCRHDKGHFITSGVQVVRNTHDGGAHGLGIHRMYRIDKEHLGCLAPLPRRIGLEHYKNSEKGIGTPIAIFFGADPIFTLASQAKVPFHHEKYHVARQLIRGYLNLTKIKNGFWIPSDAEVVLEGMTIPNSHYDDSYFGEYTSCYSMKSNAFIVKIERMYCKEDYIMPFYVTGRAPNEDINLCGPSVAAHIYQDLKQTGSDIQDVSCYIGNGVFSSNVTIKKRTNAEVITLLHRMASSNYIKIGAVMDDDLNPNSEEDFRFALETRYRPNEDTITTGLMTGASLDPSFEEQNQTQKLLLDLTIPIGKTPGETERNRLKHARVDVPGELEASW